MVMDTKTRRVRIEITVLSLLSEVSLKILHCCDTGSPWDREFLIQKLQEHELQPQDVTHVVCTHGHVDHVGNLFTMATHMVSHDIVKDGDKYTLHELRHDNPFQISKFCYFVGILLSLFVSLLFVY